jgi:iron complex transport system ATP-binding protein
MTIEAKQVCLKLAGFQLLSHIDLIVNEGEITAICGPNGAGKTSLLRVLVGDLAASSGSVYFNGKPIADHNPQKRARNLSVLPQHSSLDFPFTAEEVVQLGRIPHQTGVRRDQEIVDEALAAVDASYLAKRFYTHLSGGEKQRVHLARVLAQVWEENDQGGRFLVLDEPTSSFDLAHQQLTISIVRSLAQQNVGVLMVMHDLSLAAGCADHMVLMRCGEKVAEGNPAVVLQKDIISEVFEVDASVQNHPHTGKPMVII